jgi:hypothetical protein
MEHYSFMSQGVLLTVHQDAFLKNPSFQALGGMVLILIFGIIAYIFLWDERRSRKEKKAQSLKEAQELSTLYANSYSTSIDWDTFTDILVKYHAGGSECSFLELKTLFKKASRSREGISSLITFSKLKERLVYNSDYLRVLFQQINRLYLNAYQDYEIQMYRDVISKLVADLKPVHEYKGYQYLLNMMCEEFPSIKEIISDPHDYRTATFVG